MNWFVALDPPQQSTIIGGVIAVLGTIVIAILGGAGWGISYLIQSRTRRKDLRRIKMQRVMGYLIKVNDWAVSDPKTASHPADHIFWLCEVYGGSDTMTAAARRLSDACNELADLARGQPHNEEFRARLDALNVSFDQAYQSTRTEALSVLRELSGIK